MSACAEPHPGLWIGDEELSGCGWPPVFRKQDFHFRRVDRRNATQDVRKVDGSIVSTAACADQKGVDHRAAPTRLWMADKHPVLAEAAGPNGVLDEIVLTTGLC